MDKISEYGRVYSEIARGYSEKIVEGKVYYFKHPTQAEHFAIFDRYEAIVTDAKRRGMETEEEKIAQAIAGGWWDQAKEDHVASIRKVLKGLRKTKDKLLYPSQKQEIDTQIIRNERILTSYLKQRRDITGYTVEQYANEKFHDETILRLTFKNVELTERLFTDEDDYYYLSEEDVDGIRNAFNAHTNILNGDSVKLIAACGFFQNLIFVSDSNPIGFWGKPTVGCSKYQIDLLIYGKMYRNMIKNAAESGEPVSDDIVNNPERFVSWVDGQSGRSSSSSSSSVGGEGNKMTTPVGATAEDLKTMGVKVEKIGGKSLLQLAEEAGGSLDKTEYMNLRASA